MHADARDALAEALAAVGLSSALPRRDAMRADLVVDTPDGRTVEVEVKAASIATAEQVDRVTHWRGEGVVPILVADQVPAAMRRELNAHGMSWLDRRGHLRLTAPGVFVDADVPPTGRRAATRGAGRDPIGGRSGLAAACGLLVRPDEPMGVSEIARIADLNPSSITRALTALAEAHLVERRGRGAYRALVPELFWALADAWPRERTTIRWNASPSDRDDANWVSGGVRGALAWGAPIVATSDLPVDLYLPDERTIRRLALQHHDDDNPNPGAEVRLAVDLTGLVRHEARPVAASPWPVAHPLFCALDLTATARDREALEQWTPPEGFTRVW
jgi:DNA-binding transcriptional ArsR family regulator